MHGAVTHTAWYQMSHIKDSLRIPDNYVLQNMKFKHRRHTDIESWWSSLTSNMDYQKIFGHAVLSKVVLCNGILAAQDYKEEK